MPHRDGTGPMGMGPMTGRRAGFCAGFQTAEHMNPAGGQGFGGGWGRSASGRGWRNRFYATGLTGWQRAGWGYPATTYPTVDSYTGPYQSSKEQQIEMLKGQAEYFATAIDNFQERIKDLASEKIQPQRK